MPDDTTILSLPLILPAQAQKHVTHNEALVALDLIVQLTVINRTLTTTPSLPSIGDRHIVAAGATGPWVGQSGRIALFTVAGWQFTQPLPGWRAHVLAEGQTAVFDGLVWKTTSEGPLSVTRLGVSATADATNRLSVSAPATLLTHAGSGHQLKLNKAAAGDTASLLFQTGFGGRAEMGTAGSDDFTVKVSADGSTWFTAVEADAATGEVTLPQPMLLGGQAADPVSPADGTLWLNTTTGEIKVRSAGTTLAVGSGGGGVTDGDKGDITVSGTGASWVIDAGAVTLGKLADMATDSFLGRDTAGTGVPEVLSPAQARGILNVADGATAYTDEQAQDAVGAMVDASLTYVDGTPLLQRAALTGDVTAAAGGNATTIANDAVTFAKLQNIGTDTLIGRDTAGTGDPEAITVTGGIEFSGAGAIRTGAFTGDVTKTAGGTALTIASDAVTNAKAADMATATLKGRVTAGTGDPEDLTGTQATTLLDAFSSTLKGLAPASGGGTTNFLRADGTWAAPSGGGGVSDGDKGDITVSGGGVTWTIDAGVVTLAKMADLATARILGRTTAGTGVPEALTGAQATALLDAFTSGAKGLAPASGGGTTNFLRADGTWAAPSGGGGGSPGGASGEIQFNSAGSFGGAADVEIEGGQLRLPTISTPTAPAAAGLKLFGRSVAGRTLPAFMGPSGLDSALQASFARNRMGVFMAAGNGGTDSAIGMAFGSTGTATTANVATTNLHTLIRRREYLVTTASTSAVVGFRGAALQFLLGGPAAGQGGFFMVSRWGPATGVATATTRAFFGMRNSTAAPTDVNPSTLTNICGMGWDAGDTNVQFMHNDGSGTATKIDLGASFPRPTTDRTAVYEIALFAPPGTTQSLGYEVTDLVSGASATGTLTTNLPSTTTLITPWSMMSVGGTSSVIGMMVSSSYIETDV